MRITVVIQSPTTVTVTHRPGLLDRLLLGRREVTREAFLAGLWQWVWTDSQCFVDPDTENAIHREVSRAFDAQQEASVRR